MFNSRNNSPASLLILNPSEVIRADMGGGKTPTVKRFEKADRPEDMHISIAAELAASLISARLSKRTIIVSQEFWTGVIDIDDRSVYGLEGDDLTQMLKFETEVLSNLDPMNSRLACLELSPVPPDTRRFWMTSIASETAASLDNIVANRGGKLATLIHPMGLVGPDPNLNDWTEIHGDIAGAFQRSETGLARAAITPISRQSDRWLRSLGAMYGSNLPTIGWETAETASPNAFDGKLFSLSDAEQSESWITRATTTITAATDIPAVRPAAAATNPNTYRLVGAIALFLIAIACGLDFLVKRSTTADLQTQIDGLDQPLQQKRMLESRLKELTTEVSEKQQAVDLSKQNLRQLSYLEDNKKRFSELLQLIGLHSDKHLVLEAISLTETGVILSGRVIVRESAHNLATKISDKLSGRGWASKSIRLDGTNQLTTGGPWDFSIHVDEMPTGTTPIAQDAASVDATEGAKQPASLQRPVS